ncbi:MAG: glycosyl transferase [Bacteroidia bacterium]|nr:MAG: glycosyl transferase [Bacteroidia bacterium]
MEYFCTLFNQFYLARGLTMIESLLEHCSNAVIYVFAFDNETFNYLSSLQNPKIIPISLNDFEDEELLKVKKNRTITEYCWTSTSSTLLYLFKKYNLPQCTYLDADLFFYHSPEILIHELPYNKSVLLTEHRYTPQYDTSQKTGKFCVQFMTFKNNEEGLKALTWWREQCLKWCYARFENGKFGDQKYLDDWESRFPFVYVLQNLGGGVAPWNIQQYDLQENDFILHDSGKSYPLVFYHFHYVKFYDEYLELGRYKLSDEVITKIYKPYIQKLIEKEKILPSNLNVNGRTPFPYSWKFFLVQLKRISRGVNYLYKWKRWEKI